MHNAMRTECRGCDALHLANNIEQITFPPANFNSKIEKYGICEFVLFPHDVDGIASFL